MVGQGAFSFEPWEHPSDRAFGDMDYDAVNMHPLRNTTFAGTGYNMGAAMSKQLALRGFRDYCLASYDAPSPLNLDEDNVSSQYKDEDAWTIHRKRAWMALLTGNHYDYIDFSILPRLETGTPKSQRCIRTWMKHLSTFIHAQDLINSRPLPELLKQVPPHTVGVAFGVAGEDMCVYLADERELPGVKGLPDDHTAGTGSGSPIAGGIVIDLPDASYHLSVYSPKSGLYSPVIDRRCGAGTQIPLQPFSHDVVVKITRV